MEGGGHSLKCGKIQRSPYLREEVEEARIKWDAGADSGIMRSLPSPLLTSECKVLKPEWGPRVGQVSLQTAERRSNPALGFKPVTYKTCAT